MLGAAATSAGGYYASQHSKKQEIVKVSEPSTAFDRKINLEEIHEIKAVGVVGEKASPNSTQPKAIKVESQCLVAAKLNLDAGTVGLGEYCKNYPKKYPEATGTEIKDLEKSCLGFRKEYLINKYEKEEKKCSDQQEQKQDTVNYIEEQNNVSDIEETVALLNKAKENWEGVYGAVETNKRNLIESEIRFLDSRINNLSQGVSSITDCGASTASDVSRINVTFDARVNEQKRISQKSIDRSRAYGFEETALLEEKGLVDKITQIESERSVEIAKMRGGCESSSGLLRSSLQSVLDSVKTGRNDIVEYSSSHAILQEEIKKEILSIELQQEKLKSGQDKEAVTLYDAQYQKIHTITLQLNQLGSSIERRVNGINSDYKNGINSAFRSVSIVQSVNADLNAINNKVQEYGDTWGVANTPMRCSATSGFSSGKINTIMTCEGAGAPVTNPVRCRATSQWVSGKLNSTMVCEQN